MSGHKFPYKWYLKDGYPAAGIESNGLKVFGTFICGGGSTMGYKLAGFEHLGGVEIDKKVSTVYQLNHNPKNLYTEDMRDFVKRTNLPEELYKLDLLDGSPPCSSFSMAGNRETDWNKNKVFKEGQKHQKLDDLFFTFIELAKKLQPKVIVAENVKGLISGNAKFYVSRINKELVSAGYKVQLFLLNAASMGVPQKRERVFFICQRVDLGLPDLKLKFDEPRILFKKLIEKEFTECDLTVYQKKLWDNRIKKDKAFGDIIMRTEGRLSMFSNPIVSSDDVANTLTSSAGVNAVYDFPRGMTRNEFCMVGSFPMDYDFNLIPSNWLIGMSVPPVMTAQIAHQIYLQWFKNMA